MGHLVVVIVIAALIISKKSIYRVEVSMAGLHHESRSGFSSLRSEFKAEFAEIRPRLDLINGSMKALVKRFSTIW